MALCLLSIRLRVATTGNILLYIEIYSARYASQQVSQVNTDEMFREKVRQSLVTSAKSGKLEQTVLAAHTDDMLREKAKQSLITSAKNGTLEQAVREANKSKAGDPTRVKPGQDLPSAASQADLDKDLQMKLKSYSIICFCTCAGIVVENRDKFKRME